MFIRRSKYEQERIKALEVRRELFALQVRWNDLIDKLNAKGGRAFLEFGPAAQFSDSEIKQLISLCHPDKHGGRRVANEMTQKLISMRSGR